MKLRIPILLHAVVFSLSCYFGRTIAQPITIAGTVNTYAAVTAVDTAAISMTLSSAAVAAGFAIDDLVLIYQTQGAAINQTNSSSFGTVTDLQDAGAFELARVCTVVDDELFFQSSFERTYFDNTAAAKRIQIIKVPEYNDAVVNGTLTAPAWNGQTGGVLALSVYDTLYVNGTIDLSERGFRGGTVIPNTATSCNALSNASAYFYASAIGATNVGGLKGEGIAVAIPGKEYGRGPQANGGGGGNDHNAGGAGGGNGGTGGQGGERFASFWLCQGDYPGLSGKSMTAFGYGPGNIRAYLGGGGGAGDDNNGEADSGASGGGLILLMANVITGTGTIETNGGSVLGTGADGAGGGGAGGSILLFANQISGAGLNLQANGGDGGDTKIRCEGPGGGGGGGVIWSNVALGGAATSVAAGAHGVAQACGNAAQGAADGTDGTVVASGLFVPEGLGSGANCILPAPLSLRGRTQGSQMWLDWDHLSEATAYQLFGLDANGQWMLRQQLEAGRSAVRTPVYDFQAFRLQARMADDNHIWSNSVQVRSSEASTPPFQVHMTQSASQLLLSWSGLESGPWLRWDLLDQQGRKVRAGEFAAVPASLTIPLNGLASGVYLIRFRTADQARTLRFFHQP